MPRDSSTAMTDADGRFSFEVVPVGTYTVSFTASGFAASTSRVDVTSGHVATLGGSALHLTRRELAILGMLTRHPGRTFTREYLLDHVWGDHYDGLDRAVDVLGRTGRDAAENSLGGRIDDVESLAAARVRPLSVDVHLAKASAN